MVYGSGVAEHIGAIADDGHDRTVRTRELGSERRAGSPAQAGRGARSEIEVRKLEATVLGEQRVFVDDDAARILGAVETVAHPHGIERVLAGGGTAGSTSGSSECRALVGNPAPARRDDRFDIKPAFETRRPCRQDRKRIAGDGDVAWKAPDRVARI